MKPGAFGQFSERLCHELRIESFQPTFHKFQHLHPQPPKPTKKAKQQQQQQQQQPERKISKVIFPDTNWTFPEKKNSNALQVCQLQALTFLKHLQIVGSGEV